jgi:hypothetical protein
LSCHISPYLSLKLSLPARCTGLKRYSITRRLAVLISAMMFMLGLKAITRD